MGTGGFQDTPSGTSGRVYLSIVDDAVDENRDDERSEVLVVRARF